MMDVVQPWTVGRYRDAESVDKWKDDMIVAGPRAGRARTASCICRWSSPASPGTT